VKIIFLDIDGVLNVYCQGRDDDGLWEWKSKNVNGGSIVHYAVHEKYTHYGPNVYDHAAYKNCKMV